MRILKYAFRNIIRNPLLSISSIFVITLLIFFVNILLGVLYTSERFIAWVNDRISFTISFQSGYTVSDVRVRTLADALQTAFTGIAIETISKKQAFALLKERNPDLTALIENSWENPLPDSLRIDNIPLDQYSMFNEIISQEKDILFYDKDSLDRKYLDFQSQFQRVSTVVKLLSTLSYAVYALLGLFIFTVAVIIYTVIGNSIFFHKQEIEIIELVGGRSSFIYGPFLLQWAFYGSFATLLALALVVLLSALIPIDFIDGPLAHLHSHIHTALPRMFLIEVVVFFSLGIISSFIALRRYVRV
jgi:cell division transport system permease protein